MNFAVQRLYVQGEKGAGLIWDPGVGKSFTTLLILEQLRDLGEVENVLLVAPLRVCKLVWEQEIEENDFDFTTNMLCQRVKAGLKQTAFIDIINPESLHLLKDHCHRYDMLVIDESSSFKNWGTKRMKQLRKMLPNFSKRMILTGTPAANSLSDLHAQSFILDDGVALGKNVTVFRSLYCRQGGFQGRIWELRSGVANTIQEAFAPLVHRLDAETCLDMPELIIHRVDCALPDKCKPEYQRLKKELLAELETGTILAMSAGSAYSKMKQFASGNVYDSEKRVHFVHDEKIKALKELAAELHGKPLLCFYQFSHEREAIQKVFKGAPALCGGVKAAVAEKMVDDWNTNRTPLFLVQVQSGSHGLNLQHGECADVAFYGVPDRPELYIQAFRRVYRQGQKGSKVRVHRILTRGTVDDTIEARLDQKGQTQKEFLESLKKHARSIDK